MSKLLWPQMPFPRSCMGMQPGACKSACAMGVDVHYGRYDVGIADVIRPKADMKIVRLVFYGSVRDEHDVIFLANQYPVVAGVWDCRPEATLTKRAIERLRKQGKDFWRMQYATNPTNIELTFNDKEKLITAERTMTLDSVFFALNCGVGFALPQNWREAGGRESGEDVGAFGRQLMVPTKVPGEWHGQPYDRWTEGEDHSFHVLNGLLVAIGIAKLHLPRGDNLIPSPGKVVSRQARDPVDPLDDPEGDFWDEGDGAGSERDARPMSWEA